MYVEVFKPDTIVPNSIFGLRDLAWPNGIQEGFSQPVVLLIDEPIEVEEAVNRAGFEFFTNA
jgi:hypothetical protein